MEKVRLSVSSSFSHERPTTDITLSAARSKGLKRIFRDSAKTVNFRWKIATKSGLFKAWRSRLHKAASPQPAHARGIKSEPDVSGRHVTPNRDHELDDESSSRDHAFDDESPSLRGPTVIAGIIAGSVLAGWSPLEPPPIDDLRPLPETAQILQPDSEIPFPNPSQEAISNSEEHQEYNNEANHRETDLVNDEGIVPQNNGSSTLTDHILADQPGVDTANESKDPDPEPNDDPDMARIEVEYPSRYICDGGESVYFSTSHHEVTEPAMFTTARATLDRLQPDLEPIMGRLGRKAKASSSSQVNLVTVELRMAGVVEAGGTTVTLRPSVWITCRDKSTCKAVRHRLDQLVWLNSSHYSPVYVRSVLRLASTERYTVLRELDFSHGTPFWMDTPEGQIRRDVHIHVERSGKSASHGLLSCITITRSGDDTVLYQEFCRIGGHIIINQHTRPQHVAVTTGHGLLEYWIQEEMNYVGNSPEPGEAEAEATVLEDIYSDDYTEPDERTKLTDRPIDTEINLVTNWEPALLFPDNINFVSQASPTMGGFFEIRTNSISIDTDFLLLSATTRRDSGAPMMANAMEEVSVNSYMSDETMSSSKIAGTIVSVKSGEPQTAEILPDTIPFFVNGVVLQTKKVQLSKPTSPGLSGSWVIHKNDICGVIIAIYDGEPFALMLTAEKLFSDIVNFSSTILSARVATEEDNISHPLKQCESETQSGTLLTEAVISPQMERESIRESLDYIPVKPADNMIMIKKTVDIPGSSPPHSGSLSGRFEKRVSRFAHQSAFWLQKGVKRLRKRRDATIPPRLNENYSPNGSTNNNTLMTTPNTRGVNTVASRTSSASSE